VGNRRFNQVFQHRQMREQVEVLKDVAHVNALAHLSLLQLIELIALAPIANVVAINLNKPFIHSLKMVYGAQQG
jgi:hypothetical protein